MKLIIYGKIVSTVLILLTRQQSQNEDLVFLLQHQPRRQYLSFSDSGRFLIVGNKSTFFLLQLCAGTFASSAEYKLISRVSGVHEESEQITALYCLELSRHLLEVESSQARSDVDLLCAIVGYSNGTVRLFDRKGKLLRWDLFHPVSVLEISISNSNDKDPSQLYIYYETGCVVAIDIEKIVEALSDNTTRPIQYQKWRLVSPEGCSTNGTISIGNIDIKHAGPGSSLFPNPHLYSISNSQSSSMLPCEAVTNCFIRIGHNPAISFHPVFKKPNYLLTASNIASFVTNSISAFAKSFLSTAQPSQPQLQQQNITTPTAIDAEISLNDGSRTFTGIYMAPLRFNLAALTDNLGRIWLLDTAECELIRVWKGLRDSQCAWIEYPQIDPSSEPILLLVIYSARRNLIQVYRMRHYQKRIAAISFECSGNAARLFTIRDSETLCARAILVTQDGCVHELQLDPSEI